MSEYAVIGVANTRVGMKSGHPAFAEWLSRHCAGFLSDEEPHFWVHMNVNETQAGCGDRDRAAFESSPALFVTAVRGGDRCCELSLGLTGESASDLFWLGIQVGLRLAMPAKRPLDLLLHAAGIVRDGQAYVFVGPSGAGKSTVCRLSVGEPGLTILHDDIVALSQTADGFRAWSTPFGGEVAGSRSIGAPLAAVFFLVQDESPSVSKVNGRRAMGLAMKQLVPPVACTGSGLVLDHAESLKMLLSLVECVPCYRLHFRPDSSFWEYIERPSPGEESTTVAGEGAR